MERTTFSNPENGPKLENSNKVKITQYYHDYIYIYIYGEPFLA